MFLNTSKYYKLKIVFVCITKYFKYFIETELQSCLILYYFLSNPQDLHVLKVNVYWEEKWKKKSHFLSHYFSIQSFDFREKQNCSLFITILHIFNLNIMKIYLFNFLSN